ncbi:D-alanyl-D-alanine carboxypeptidase [Mycobacterium simulans]|uniref:serine hydrolase domain-containing protein n=1 Tax=Mycobacterium simulans TaxID=627089 RepID=UPI0017488EAB|nr:serine hydrolase domain-containing protein [Mycobacterium simulans]SON63125.1 D-alanyl-D-alanine carboxypeptidase [Mycobacterium simulans]
MARADHEQRIGRPLRLIAVALLLAACGGKQMTNAAVTTTTGATQTLTVKAHNSQDVLNGAVLDGEPGCSAAVGIEGKVAWAGARGLANLATGIQITADTVFDIASVSKQFTATAVLLLVDAGKLTLEDALSEYVPDLPAWSDKVTIAELMHHTSGIPDYIGLLQEQGYQFNERTTQSEALQALAAAPELVFKPGSRYEYSNSNYLLLGEIVHRLSGQSLPEFLSTQIFQPLGLAMVLDPAARIPNKALSYAKGDASHGGYQVADSPWEQIGDGGIQTTPTQLVRWADNYRTGKVGGPQLLDEQLAGAVQTEPGGGDRYGAGIFSLANGMLDHDGAWAGFVTAFRVSSDRRTSVAISCNVDKQDPEAMADALGRIWM